VASVAVGGAPAEAPADSAVALAASALTASGAAFPGAAFAWSRTGTAAGEITAVGAGAAYRGMVPGTDTVTVTAAGGGRTATARVVVTVRGPRVAAVTFPAAVAYVGVGATFALPAAGRTAGGAVDPRATITYRVDAAAPAASVAGHGTVTGAAVGTARVIAAAPTTGAASAWPADTLTVVVAGGAGELSVALDDTVLVAGRPLALTGADLAGGLSAQVDGLAAGTAAGSAGATLLTPAALFSTCQPLGRRVPVTLAAAGKARTLDLGVYAPQRLALAPGQHVPLTDAAAAGCPVTVDAAGTYVVMPFAWDRGLSTGGTAGGTGRAARRRPSGSRPAGGPRPSRQPRRPRRPVRAPRRPGPRRAPGGARFPAGIWTTCFRCTPRGGSLGGQARNARPRSRPRSRARGRAARAPSRRRSARRSRSARSATPPGGSCNPPA
jgi:hypothetical protein